MLTSLPPEVLLKIFHDACLDDGTTGRSLSSVSRSIRRISAEYRYQSLAVDVLRGRTTRLLLSTLTATPEHLRRIRYLYINRAQHFTNSTFDPWFGIDVPAVRYKKEKETGRDLREILRLAAPHVETLTLLFQVGAKESLEKGDLHLEDLHMPRLRELTVDCPAYLLKRVTADFAPVLKRLCIPSRLLTREFGEAFPTRFPHLTRLLILPLRYLTTEQWRTLRVLMFTMGLHSGQYVHGPDVTRLAVMSSTSRRYIIVQPYLSTRDLRRTANDRHATLTDCLKNCAMRSHRFVVLSTKFEDETAAAAASHAGEWKVNWLESVQGGVGVWDYRNVPRKPCAPYHSSH